MKYETIRQLIQNGGETCVSFYMPTEHAGREVRQNRIRFENLTRDLDALLQKDEATSTEDRAGILRHFLKVLEPSTETLIPHPKKGLVIFATPKTSEQHVLQHDLPEQVHVGERFYLRPLLPLLNDMENFVVLAVSQNSVRLFEGTNDTLIESPHDQLPDSLRTGIHQSSRQTADCQATDHGDFQSRCRSYLRTIGPSFG